MEFTHNEEQELPYIISTPRFATYRNAANNDVQVALNLYKWNLEISSSFIVPLQVCEVAARNGVVLAVEQTYGADWHISNSFEQSLPTFRGGYSPSQDFTSTKAKLIRNNALTAGRIVADLKFAFWENMLTRRHDQRLWTPHYTAAFPNADVSVSIYQARAKAKSHLEKIRKLRNRIAHHEPIFVRNIQEEYDRILEVIEWRSPISKDWVHKIQKVTDLNEEKPIP